MTALAVIWLAAGAMTSARAAYIPTAELLATDLDTVDLGEPARKQRAETDVYCLALAVYFEEGSTSEFLDGQRHIARVVTQRARADRPKWGGRDICDVVFHKRAGVCQFSFACLPQARRTPRGGSRWQRAIEIAGEELAGRSELSESSIRYYMNPALTSDRNACRFRKEFVPVLESGRHEFFREPNEDERKALAASEPVECQRYKAALELKAKLAKAARAAAEKRRKMQAAMLKAKLKAKRQRYARK